MSSITDNIEKSTVTSKSVVENLKSLSSNLSKNIKEKVDDISTIDNESITITEGNTSNTLFTIIKYIVIILLIGFILLNILAIYEMLPLYLADLFRPIIFSISPKPIKAPKPSIKKPVTLIDKTPNQKKSKKLSDLDVIEKDLDRGINDIERGMKEIDRNIARDIKRGVKDIKRGVKDIGHDVVDLIDLAVPGADMASSNIQKHKSKAGYCYVGEDRGYRSCVKVSEKDICMSGDIFPTHDICINPNLRE